METAEQIRRQQALVNSASRRMSPQVSFTGAPVNLQSLILTCIIFWRKCLTSSLYLLQPLENGHQVSNEVDILFSDRLASCPSQVFLDRVSLTVFFAFLQEPLAPIPSRRFGTESFRRSRIERQPHVCA